MTTGEATLTRPGEVTFMGHPKGLFYLAFTEAWERFSFYGMTALVVLYMVNQLLLPGHVEHIGGFSGFRAALESQRCTRESKVGSSPVRVCAAAWKRVTLETSLRASVRLPIRSSSARPRASCSLTAPAISS